MTDAIESVRQSPAWDARFGLPLCPKSNNPWIYGAYSLKVLRGSGLSAMDELSLLRKFDEFADGCRIRSGLLNRWPDGIGGVTSYDELMGMAYISKDLAYELVAYLDTTDGVYLNIEDEKIGNPNWEIRFNVYRMIFLRPFLRARAGYSLNLASQLMIAGHLFSDAWLTKASDFGNAGGRLKNWIMLDTIEKTGPLARAAVYYWRTKMNRLGFSPKESLSREPGIPELAQFAAETF